MPEDQTTEGDSDVQETKPKKRVRPRKKQLYANLLKQMEFYFSDANLIKDRFLGELVKNDPYVPLETFLKFNKIRNITQEVNDIAKSTKHSTILELSEDRTKVKRKTPLQPYDADTRTVYVESIPTTATRDWLERVFSEYGTVAYISLPKFKQSQNIKGYAFVEFTSSDDAKKCINVFTKLGCKLPTTMPPEDLSSIKLFSIDDPGDNKDTEDCEPPRKKKKNRDKKPQKGLDLKAVDSPDSNKKLDTPTDENKSITTPTTELSTPGVESKDEISSQDEGLDGQGTEQGAPRKKKSRKKIKEKKKPKNNDKEGAIRGALWGLQVLPKSEWKSLRNKYLNLQRKYMKEVKREIQSKRHAYSSIPSPAAPSGELESEIPSSAVQDEKQVAKLERIPGVFVKEILPEPCLDIRLTKRTIRSNVHALHVDVKEGQTEAIIRFDSAKAANDYVSNCSNPGHVMSGPEEEEQWSRAEAARAARRPRGRCRLLAHSRARAHPAPAHTPRAPDDPQPTHTHIRFDDE